MEKINLHALAFIVILLLALYLRFSLLDYTTLGTGEVEIYQAAKDYASGNIARSFYIFDTPPLIKYFGAFVLLVAGFSETALRIIPAVFGMMTVILTWFFAKKFYSKNTALLAAAMVAFSFIHIQFSRALQMETMLGFFFLLTLYYFFDFIENRKKSYVIFGAAVSLGMLTKFVMLYAVVIIIIIAFLRRYVQVRLKPQFSIVVDNYLIKALIVAVVLFFVVWPHSLLPIKTDITVSVDFADGPHVNHITPSIPQLVLALGKRSVVTNAEGLMSAPFGYFAFFLIKENIVFIVLFFLGLLAILRKAKNIDKLILISLVIFLLMIWIQNAGFTYRYLTTVMPLFAVIASRWIDKIRSYKISFVAICVVALASFSAAFAAHPGYIFHTNINYPDPEIYQSEGMKESLAYIKENCSSIYANSYYQFLMIPYYSNSTKYANQTTLPTCVLIGYTELVGTSDENTMLNNFIKTHSCELKKTVASHGILLQQIYYCN